MKNDKLEIRIMCDMWPLPSLKHRRCQINGLFKNYKHLNKYYSKKEKLQFSEEMRLLRHAIRLKKERLQELDWRRG